MRLTRVKHSYCGYIPHNLSAHFGKYESAIDIQTTLPSRLFREQTMNLNDILVVIIDSLQHNETMPDSVKSLLISIENNYINKCGLQGGNAPLSELMPLLEQYYNYPQPKFEYIDAYLSGIQALIRSLEHIHTPIRLEYSFNRIYKGDHKSYSGAITHTDRRKRALRMYSSTMASNVYIYPTVAAMRYYKKKIRMIFMDEFSNQLALAPYLKPIEDIFSNKHVTMWTEGYGPNAVNVEITRWINGHSSFSSCENDCTAMDTTVQLENVSKLVFPIYAHFLHSKDYKRFRTLIKDFFHQECFVSSQLVATGKHASFSGGRPVQNFESLLLIVMYYAILLEIKVKGKSLLDTDYFLLEVVGDDSIVCLDNNQQYTINYRSCSAKEAIHYINEQWMKYAIDLGMIVNASKQHMSFDSTVTFCKRTYSPKYKRLPSDAEINYIAHKQYDLVRVIDEYYPFILRINSIMHPEFDRRSLDVDCQVLVTILAEAMTNTIQKEWVRQFILESLPDAAISKLINEYNWEMKPFDDRDWRAQFQRNIREADIVLIRKWCQKAFNKRNLTKL